MKTFFYLKTCDTCKRILKQLKLPEEITLREIKSQPITEGELAKLYDLTHSYEVLLNKRSRLYKEQKLHEAGLSEEDIKRLILEHYTFLKRPVLVLNDQIFVGNSKKVIENATTALKTSQ